MNNIYTNYQFAGVKLDPYRIFTVYQITDPAIQHAIKKLLRLGKGHKTEVTDVNEALDSLLRWKEMQVENEAVEASGINQPRI